MTCECHRQSCSFQSRQILKILWNNRIKRKEVICPFKPKQMQRFSSINTPKTESGTGIFGVSRTISKAWENDSSDWETRTDDWTMRAMTGTEQRIWRVWCEFPWTIVRLCTSTSTRSRCMGWRRLNMRRNLMHKVREFSLGLLLAGREKGIIHHAFKPQKMGICRLQRKQGSFT